MAMAEEIKEILFVRLFLSEWGDCSVAGNPLSSEKSKHIVVRWHLIRDLVKTW